VPNLEQDERTVFVENCRHKDVSGNLFLTSKRLIFEHENGRFTKRVYVTLDLPLEAVSNVSAEGKLGKKLVVYAKKGFISDFPARLDFSVKEPLLWQDRIAAATSARTSSIEAENRRERVHKILDFNALREYMAKGGLVLQALKCPECGAPIKMPESGNQTTCEHCGNIVVAQDIFDKIRSII
jgi:ribosomal protein S27AE